MELLKSLPYNCNRSLKGQAVQKLYKSIQNKEVVKGARECGELSLLWECATGEDEVLSFLSFEAILDLVKCDKLSATQVVQKIVDCFKSSKSKTNCLHTLKKIFSFMSGTKFSVTTSNLGLAHPFNVLLVSEARSVPLFIPVLKDIFNVYNAQSDCFFELMDPFFKYVFLQTRDSQLFKPIRQTIVYGLIQFPGNVNYVLNILPWMQIEENSTELLEYLDLLITNLDIPDEILSLILQIYSEFPHSEQETILDFILRIVKLSPKLTGNALLLFHCMVNLKYLPDLSRTFEILFLILKKHKFLESKYFVLMLSLPLLQLVVGSNKKAAYLFALLTEYLHDAPDDLVLDEQHAPQTSNTCSSPVNSFLFLCKETLSSNEKRNTWLKNTSRILDSTSSSSYELLNLIGGLLLGAELSTELQAVIECLQKMCTNNPHMSVELFPLLMNKLRKLTDPEQCLSILKSLPVISTNKVSTSMTLNFLLSSGSLSSTSASLMVSLWKNHEDCFPHLIGQLQDCNSAPNEASLVKAKCLRDICRLSATKHGKECTAMLFQLLEKRNDPPVRIICLDAIYYLCLEKVLSFQSYWSYFQTNLKPLLLSKNVTPVEARSMLKIFQILSGSEVGTLSQEVITFLWSLLSCDVKKCVIDEAFITLSLFPRSAFVLSQLPQEVIKGQLLKMEEKEVDESLREAIYGDTYIELVAKLYSGEIQNGLERFFMRLMEDELLSLPRGVFFKYKEMIRLSFTYQLKMDGDHAREVDLKISKLATTCLHLPVNSLMKSCFEYIINFVRQGMPEEKLPQFKMIVRSLMIDTTKHLLPPFNWFFILRPILIHEPDCIDEETIEICYKFIFQQSVYYPILGHLLLQLIDSSEFDECKLDRTKLMMKNFGDMLTICPVRSIKDRFVSFVHPCLERLKTGEEDAKELLKDFVTNLRDFASSQVALKESKNYVWELLANVLSMIPVEFHREMEVMVGNLPQVVVDGLLKFPDACSDVKKLFLLRAFLVSADQRSISFINYAVETFVKLDSTEEDKCFTSVLMLQVFQNCLQHKTSSLKQWMVEMMSFIKFYTRQQNHKALDWLLVVWFSSVVKSSKSGLDGLLFFPLDSNYEAIMEFAGETNYNAFSHNLMNLLPDSLSQLLKDADWSCISEKVLDLLYHLLSHKDIQLSSRISETITESLRCLRNVGSCKNPSFWLKFAELLDFRRRNINK